MLAAIKELALARYKYVKGDPDSLDLVKKSVKKLNTLKSNSKDQKRFLEFALETYDTIKNNTKTSAYDQIDYLTSKISALLLLPFPKCGLPTLDDWELEPWIDPEYPPQPGWKRLHDIPELVSRNPKMEMVREGEILEQGEKGVNCSLVSSMVSIYSFDSRVLNQIIYPKNDQGMPQYTPSGHYIIRLKIGGTWRMVEIDDYVPWDDRKVIKTALGSLLPILVEKAYLKSMGGYQFRGSNAALDSFQLASGVPMFYDLQNHYLDNNILTFENLYELYTSRRALICIGTGPNAPCNLERNHDFAVVGMSPDNKLTVINPWSDKPIIYTWAEAQELFHVLYMSYNPCYYSHLRKFNEVAPIRTEYLHLGVVHSLPQYLVTNNNDEPVEVLFTTTIKPTSQGVSGVLQLTALKTSRRVVFAEEVPVLAQTLEVEALCLSLSVTLPPHQETVVVVKFKDVVSDFDTVAIYCQTRSRIPIQVEKLKKPPESKLHRGQFPAVSGRYGTPQYFLNPSFELKVNERCQEIRIFLASPTKPCQLSVYNYNGKEPTPRDEVGNSGPYATGIQFVVMYDVQPGVYLAVPSLYEPSRSAFYMSCLAKGDLTFEPTAKTTAGYFENSAKYDRGVQVVRIMAPNPCHIIAYISDNCTIDKCEAVVKDYLDLHITWKFGEKCELDVFSEMPIHLEPQIMY